MAKENRGDSLPFSVPVFIGGFVKLYGEDDAGSGRVVADIKEAHDHDPDEKRAFYNKPIGERILVVFAGVCMNAFLAAVIYYVFFAIGNFQTTLPLIGNHKFFEVDQYVTTQVDSAKLKKILPHETGITPFSTIQSLNGQNVTQLDSFASIIKSSAGKPLLLPGRMKTKKTTRQP